jgi:transcriptional regulator with XRE-family HTH domain
MRGEALEHADLEIACVLAQSGPASGETFRFIRKALGLRSASAAALLDVTAETVSRWEHGQRPVDKCAWIALGSLVLEKFDRTPQTMTRLLMLQEPARAARLVRIDLDSARLASRDEAHEPETARAPRRRAALSR